MNKSKFGFHFVLPAVVFTISLVVFILTACRTIAWWDCPRYVLASAELGIPPPPGSLLLTVIGWAVAKIPIVQPIAFRLNLLAGLFAAITAAIIVWLTIRLFLEPNGNLAVWIGAVVAGLSLAFSLTMWNYAVQLTPYILTTVFTGLILWALLLWWEQASSSGSWRWLFLTFLLFGLDFSVHRTNSLLLPGALVWIGLRNLGTYRSLRTWACIFGGLAAGLALHFVLILMAARGPFLNFGDPSTLRGFWHYVSLQQYGGGFLFDIFHRKAGFFNVQVMQYLRIFAANFAVASNWWVTLLPVLFGLFGCVRHFIKDRRQALGLLALFLMASLGGIIYYNVPENYIRPVDRHYMPSLVIFSLWIGHGVVTLLSLAGRLGKRSSIIATVSAACLVMSVPVGMALHNWKSVDLSRSFFAGDFARNMLVGLPRDAILFTNGDNDTFPLWCLQKVEKVRPDVDVININVLNTGWYLRQMARNYPGVPLDMTGDQCDRLAPALIRDTTLVLPLPDTDRRERRAVQFTLADTSGKYVWKANSQAIYRIIRNNRWQRPICFAITLDFRDIAFVIPYLRFEGLHHQLMPQQDPPMDTAVVKMNMTEVAQYRGLNDRGVKLYGDSRMMSGNYAIVLMLLAQEQRKRGAKESCHETVRFIEAQMPPDRLGMPGEFKAQLDSLRM